MATPHNQAQMGEIAKTVLMPGDPLRAQFIAETFLENPVQFNSVRNMFGYTGTYKGKKVSVMGSGMGIPSISLYAYELYKFYGVENIIRIGSCGAYTEDMQVFDTILATGAYSESTYAKCMIGDTEMIQKPSEELNERLREAAEKLNIKVHEGLIWSSDVFYYDESVLGNALETAMKYNLLAAEMESFGLFATAKALGKKAACILTVSDNIVSHVETTAEERRTCLTNMIKIALESTEAE
ncbi:MAG: purine-nucleoside phosphorylase [Erysipelotrichaceae bacterium]|nr:purine-nucleoside phosphorylase [Erysipelotrichaceae bacterium]MBR2533860.1 purine-nucleoside phosphorylase [Erysipelotrichaceae bacterium]